MVLSAIAQDMSQLALLRVITGIGIGGILPTVNVLVAEYSSDRWRSTLVSIYAAGYPIGATLGGAVAAILIRDHGWRSAFIFGAILSVAMLPIAAVWLPESVEFLLKARTATSLNRLNALLRRMSLLPLSEMPEIRTAGDTRRPGWKVLLSGASLGKCTLIATAFFMTMATLYFVNSWTPKLLTSSGMSVQQGISSGVLFNLGGIFGSILFGLICAYVNLRFLTAVFVVLSALSVALFGNQFQHLSIAMALAVLMGAALNGSIAGLYALTVRLFPTEMRGRGTGFALGVGRLGAIASPSFVGLLVDRQWPPSSLYMLFAAPLAVALCALGLLRSRDMQL
jgi:MFS family permease